jgi:ubiquinone/menaquinone biosynthesis C-methylase UbiE
MNHFNQIANTWDSSDKIEMSTLYAQKIKSVIVRKDSIKILEVGCGTGLLGSYFTDNNNQLIGVDTSSGMLDVFNKKFSKNDKIKSYLINLEKETLEESAFNLIISSMAFHHLKNPKAMITKLKNMLSSDGQIIIIDLDKEDGSFHPDPKNMGVEHFGFSKFETDLWGKNQREIINVMKKDKKEYPIFMAVFN